jgi:hypothetical protein
VDPGRGPSRLLAQYMYMWIKQTKRRFWAARLMSLENDRFVNEPRGQMLMAVDSTVNECGLCGRCCERQRIPGEIVVWGSTVP